MNGAPSHMTEPTGIVYLVGAGPGDPGLLTARALELIVAADVIVHDRLIPRDALAAAGIPFEVVPGVTAGVAAPAYAGIPVTHRDDASAVAFVTGHEDPEKDDAALDYEALARFPGTLVFYMGVKALPRIAERLIEAGRATDEPAAVVERGTLPGQRTVTSTLEGIAPAAADAGIAPPSVTIVGRVAARRERL